MKIVNTTRNQMNMNTEFREKATPFKFQPNANMCQFVPFAVQTQPQNVFASPMAPKLNAPEFIRNNQHGNFNNLASSSSQNFQSFVPTAPALSPAVFTNQLSFSDNSDSENYLSVPNPHNKGRKARINSDEVNSDASTSAESCHDSPKRTFDIQKANKNFTNKQDRQQFVKEFKRKQKTEMCKNWEMNGSCRWGNRCSYAHGAHELVKKTHLPKNFMTKACELFHKDQFCAYGKRCQFMHSERDIYGDQLYSTVLRENARLAGAKISTVDEFDSNAQIYINVFGLKSRLSSFVDITGEVTFSGECQSEGQSDFLSKGSDMSEKRLFEDFSELEIKAPALSKKKSKQSQKKKFVLQEVKDNTASGKKKNFLDIQFNSSAFPNSDFKAGKPMTEFKYFNGQQMAPQPFVPSY